MLIAGDRLLLATFRQSPARAVATATVTLLGGAASFAVPAILATAVDDILRERTGSWLWLLAAIALDIGLLIGVLLLGNNWYTQVTAELRHRLFGQAVDLGVQARELPPSADLVSRLTTDCTAVGRLLPTVWSGVTDGLVGVAAVVALALIDWRLVLIFGVGVPTVALAARTFLAGTTVLTARYRNAQSLIAGLLLDALAGIRTIQASGTADREAERVLRPLAELDSTGRAWWSAQGRAGWQVALLVRLIQVAVLAVAGVGVSSGRITPGQLLATVAYTPLALGVLSQVGLLATVGSARASAARLADVLALSSRPKPVRRLGVADGRVELRGVRLGTVLDDINLVIPAGTTLAVVGPSGAGKTTLAWLIGGLAVPDEGEVLLDDLPLRELPRHDLAREVAYAFEKPALLGETVHDTIAFGLPGVTRAEVEQAARVAQADAFVRRLPEGYDTRIADVPLSGGEVQRIGLAALVARNARVVVLDDAMAGLDSATEALIVAALARIQLGRTTVVVAHREDTAASADLVAWISAGRLQGLAPHQQLLTDRRYRALFQPDPQATS
ncbi:ABC transporter ATP-binding protein [Kribbella albertanoniae]|uniref:ABC transporter ATP-binding protein n=1 Tax=Kribbella albertanoniae TaxID=1266829 RepID=UPI00140539DE|nr:ABC transporter ATP-binding protein [Kribbella albertanoniae]